MFREITPVVKDCLIVIGLKKRGQNKNITKSIDLLPFYGGQKIDIEFTLIFFFFYSF